MAYHPELERRIDCALSNISKAEYAKISKKQMFGGLAYLYSGKMTVGINGGDLMVRVVSSKMETALERPSVRPMDFTGRPLKEFIFVAPDGYASDAQLLHWINLGLEHAKKSLKEK